MPADKTQSVPALQRALSILEALAKSRHGLTLSQLTRGLQLPKSSVHAILLTFERSGYAQRDEQRGRYRLGMRVQWLANMALQGVGLRDRAAPFLFKLMERTGLTVHLAVLEQGEAVLIEKIHPPNAPRIPTWVGKRMALHCTSIGKALIAHLPEADMDRLIRHQGLLRYNENTIATFTKLKQELGVIRRTGYSIDDEEEEIGTRCIGAPIFDPQGEVVGALSVTGEANHMESLTALADVVKGTAQTISIHLAEHAAAAAASAE